MKPTLTLLAALLLAPLVALHAADAPKGQSGAPGPAAALTVVVAPNGDDANPGTLAAPFRTLERARDEISRVWSDAAKATGAVVILRGGTYPLATSFKLSSNHSGRADAPIVYRAQPGETVRLLGGADIPFDAFRPISDPAIRERIISEPARGRIREVDLKALGIRDYGELSRRGYHRAAELSKTPPMELFIDGRPMQLARWPNGESVRMGEILDPGPLAIPATTNGFPPRPSMIRAEDNPAYARLIAHLTGGATTGKVIAPIGWGGKSPDLHERGGAFTYEYDRPGLWSNAKDIWISGVFGMSWEWSYNRVAAIDAKTKTVRLAYGETSGLNKNWFKDFHHYENLLEEIDAPGEYFIDRAGGRLYLYPPDDMTPASTVTVSILTEPLLSLTGVSHVAFENLTLTTGRSRAAILMGGESVRLEGLDILNFTGGGLQIVGGRNHAVRACRIRHVGATGIRMSGGNWATLTPSGHVVEDCEIHHCGYYDKVYQPALSFAPRSVGYRIVRNRIHHLPHAAILVRGNDHLIESNEFHDVGLEFNDMGAIYANLGSYPAERGTVIRRNRFHSIGRAMPHVVAVYMDNQTMGWTIEENIFWNIGNIAINMNSGAHHTIRKNLFVDVPIPIRQTYNAFGANDLSEEWKLYFKQHDLRTMPHAKRYPELLKFFDENRRHPDTIIVESNLIFNPTVPLKAKSGVEHPEPRLLRAKNNRITASDPGFADWKRGDFRFKPDIDPDGLPPGFRPVPVERIGPQSRE